MAKRPAFQFYPGDWRRDAALQSCSIGARGLWIEMMCLMHDGSPYGHLRVGSKDIGTDRLARMVGAPVDDVAEFLAELEEADVARRTPSGTIYSNRMVRDAEIRAVRSKAGKQGGNPALLKQEDNHSDNQSVADAKADAVSKPKRKRATQLPEEWEPNENHGQRARAYGLNVGEEAAHFRDHHLARGSTFVDWDRAFNTWIRNAKKFQRGASPGSQAASVRNEKPRQDTPRQTDGLEPIAGKAPDRNEEADAWLEAHPEEAEDLLRECQEEMAWVLANTKRREHAEGMVRAALRRKALERKDGMAA